MARVSDWRKDASQWYLQVIELLDARDKTINRAHAANEELALRVAELEDENAALKAQVAEIEDGVFGSPGLTAEVVKLREQFEQVCAERDALVAGVEPLRKVAALCEGLRNCAITIEQVVDGLLVAAGEQVVDGLLVAAGELAEGAAQ